MYNVSEQNQVTQTILERLILSMHYYLHYLLFYLIISHIILLL